MSKYCIYDDRTDEILFVGDWYECTSTLATVDEDDESFSHLWLKKLPLKEEKMKGE